MNGIGTHEERAHAEIARQLEEQQREFRRDISRVAWKIVVSIGVVAVLAFLIDLATNLKDRAVLIAIAIVYGSALLQTWLTFWARRGQ